MELGKLSVAFFMGVFIVLPVALEAQYHRWRFPLPFHYNSFNSKGWPDSEVIIPHSSYGPSNMESGRMMSRMKIQDAAHDNIVFPDASILQIPHSSYGPSNMKDKKMISRMKNQDAAHDNIVFPDASILQDPHPSYGSSNMKHRRMMSRMKNQDGAQDKSDDLKDYIVFPDAFASISKMRNRNNNAGNDVGFLIPTCKDKHFCEHVPYYPTELVNQMLRDNPSIMKFATVDALEIAHRADTGDDELCTSEVRLRNPRSAKDINDDWMFILQSEESNFTQAIRVELCKNENAPCLKIDGLITGYGTKCKQKSIYRQLTALNHEGKIVHDFFQIPASCCCHLVQESIYRSKKVRTLSEQNEA